MNKEIKFILIQKREGNKKIKQKIITKREHKQQKENYFKNSSLFIW